MTKSSNLMSIVTIVSLFAGITGLALGFVSFTTLNEQSIVADESSIHDIYFKNVTYNYATPTQSTWYDIPNGNISIQVEAGESVYTLFTCSVYAQPAGSYCLMMFAFSVDNHFNENNNTQVGSNGLSTMNMRYSVSLQQSYNSLSAGTHVIRVRTYGIGNAYLYTANLLVYTYT